jgi:hypothetical protein
MTVEEHHEEVIVSAHLDNRIEMRLAQNQSVQPFFGKIVVRDVFTVGTCVLRTNDIGKPS